MVNLIKSGDVKCEMKVNINMNIPGLRKKKVPFSKTPSSHRWIKPFHSYERNGVLNWSLARNWSRFAFPFLPLFWLMYMMQPMIHGNTYFKENNNF